MKLIVFGATGRTGIEIVRSALSQGHTIGAFVRDPTRLTVDGTNLTPLLGDVLDSETVATAIRGYDAVICALGAGNSLGKTKVRTAGTTNIIQGMKLHGVKRLSVVSAMGIGESWRTLSLINRLFFATLLRSSRADHTAQEQVVMTSQLDWTIVRPSGLTDTDRTGDHSVGENIKAITSKIPRADVADLMLKVLKEDSYVGKAVTITN